MPVHPAIFMKKNTSTGTHASMIPSAAIIFSAGRIPSFSFSAALLLLCRSFIISVKYPVDVFIAYVPATRYTTLGRNVSTVINNPSVIPSAMLHHGSVRLICTAIPQTTEIGMLIIHIQKKACTPISTSLFPINDPTIRQYVSPEKKNSATTVLIPSPRFIAAIPPARYADKTIKKENPYSTGPCFSSLLTQSIVYAMLRECFL